MKIYNTIKNKDDLLRYCNFSEKEIAFINKFGNTREDLKAISNFAFWEPSTTDLLEGAIGGSLTGALTAAMASSRENRKKAIKKGLLLGALGGAAGSQLIPIGDSIAGPIGGGLAGYLTALHEESI